MVLQRSATTMTQDDLHHTRSSVRRPESLYEVTAKRKSDPTQEAKSILTFLEPIGQLFNRLGSGRSSQGYASGARKPQTGHGAPQHGKQGQTPYARSDKFDSGNYEKKAATTFYQLTEEKGEAVGEVGVVEGQGSAPPTTSRHRMAEHRSKSAVFTTSGKEMKNEAERGRPTPQSRPIDPHRGAIDLKGGQKRRTSPKHPSKEPQKSNAGPQKQGRDRKADVSLSSHTSNSNTTSSAKSSMPAGTQNPPRGTPGSKQGQRKSPRRTPEAQEATKDLGRSTRRRTRRKFFRRGGKCAGQEEETTTEEEEEVDGGGGGGLGGPDKPWGRHGSFRGGFGGATGGLSSASGDPSHSDTELGKLSTAHSLLDGECASMGGGSLASDRGVGQDLGGRVASWSVSFEKLLEDPAGLQTFAEFLKKEYSHENIYFWTACERFKRLTNQEELQAVARQIFERHLYSGAPEPVNVDSQARQDAQDGLHLPNEALFDQAQKQIFNLMKFDSYTRFLKSSLYTECLSKEQHGLPLSYPGDQAIDPDLRLAPEDPHVKLKKSQSDADERRRKSILRPWHRKDRSKSKDRGEAEYHRRRKHHHQHHHHHQQQQQQHQQQHHRLPSDSSSIRSISGSQTSLNSSSDLPLGRRAASRESLTSCSGGDQGSNNSDYTSHHHHPHHHPHHHHHRSRKTSTSSTCQVFLPDSSKSVVLLKPSETIQEVMLRLMERRGLTYTWFEVYMDSSNKLLCREDEAMTLKDTKVRLEPRVFFQLVLFGQKPLFVKADPNRPIGDKLKPLLSKAGHKMEHLCVYKSGEEKPLNLKAPISDLDGAKVIVQTKEDVKEWGVEGVRQKRRGGGGGVNTTTTTNTTNTSNTTTTANTTLDDITNRVFQDLRNGKMEQFEDFSIIDLDARSSRTDSSDKSSSSRRNSFGLEKDPSGGLNLRLGRSRMPLHHHHHQDHHHAPPFITKRRGGGGGGGTGGGGGGGVPDNDNELYEGLKRAQRSRLDDQRGTEINFELPEFLKNDKKQDKGGGPPSLADQLLARLECSVVGVVAPPSQYFSLAHPEVWGGLPSPPPPPPATAPSPNATLTPDLDLDDFDDTLRGEAGVDAPPSPPGLDGGGAGTIPPRVPLTALPLSPPPLPPKPKVGGVRGPPPRPPSRQLHLLNPPTPSFPPPPPSTSNSEEEGVLAPPEKPPPLPPLHLGRQSLDKFNISFV